MGFSLQAGVGEKRRRAETRTALAVRYRYDEPGGG